MECKSTALDRLLKCLPSTACKSGAENRYVPVIGILQYIVVVWNVELDT